MKEKKIYWPFIGLLIGSILLPFGSVILAYIRDVHWQYLPDNWFFVTMVCWTVVLVFGFGLLAWQQWLIHIANEEDKKRVAEATLQSEQLAAKAQQRSFPELSKEEQVRKREREELYQALQENKAFLNANLSNEARHKTEKRIAQLLKLLTPNNTQQPEKGDDH